MITDRGSKTGHSALKADLPFFPWFEIGWIYYLKRETIGFIHGFGKERVQQRSGLS